eukprot:CAMPEP_0202980410 /NCGR_PEP_ID=MMETSP1396-20130829/86347_1 /ASSEMBLY_ACC=CAM_ASM_000872 /TAXON_ID= /ORGANISM="Pseudokeronopsis sp., Strain Brazil" /LENGTH=94 /DNA_ID=CAMNT_0049720381 /DNA_START=1108 /DNA_END=1392 /DNA_ORIENTATION=-
MGNDHPLLEYIEDPFAEGDVSGYQKIIKRLKDSGSRLRIGIHKWFQSDINKIKEHTAIIPLEDDEDEEEKKADDKKEEEEKKEELPPPPEPPKP